MYLQVFTSVGRVVKIYKGFQSYKIFVAKKKIIRRISLRLGGESSAGLRTKAECQYKLEVCQLFRDTDDDNAIMIPGKWGKK